MVVDNESWILKYAISLVRECQAGGDNAQIVRNYKDIEPGDIAFYLGCMTLTPPEILAQNRKNLVVHESDLPLGRGFAPLFWQIIEGKNQIPICLLEAGNEADSGAIYLKRTLEFSGSELNQELRKQQGEASLQICLDYLNLEKEPKPIPQQGKSSWYAKRSPEDSRLDLDTTLREQFDLLRTVDNVNYPAFFEHRGTKYILKIEKA